MSQERSAKADDMARSYGFQQVDPDEKQGKVNDVFHRVARRYDIMNDVMSGGMHRLWKDAMVSWLAPSKTRPYRSLDVAGGTGDIAFRIIEASGRNAHVTVLDINGSMLDVGRERAEKAGLAAVAGGGTGAGRPAVAVTDQDSGVGVVGGAVADEKPDGGFDRSAGGRAGPGERRQ